nr:hypothetical protein [Pandoravirus belohorizontensis]
MDDTSQWPFFVLALLFFLPTCGRAFGGHGALLRHPLSFFCLGPFLVFVVVPIEPETPIAIHAKVLWSLFSSPLVAAFLFALGGWLRLTGRARHCRHAQDKARPRATAPKRKEEKPQTYLPAAPASFLLRR